MDHRTTDLLGIRPRISTARITEGISDDEYFQNAILRPVLKFQNDLLVAVFRNYIAKHKNTFYGLSLEKRSVYIENTIQKDIKFRNALKGMLIGQFTVEEYELYVKNSPALNKRMMGMVIKRLQDRILLFEDKVLV